MSFLSLSYLFKKQSTTQNPRGLAGTLHVKPNIVLKTHTSWNGNHLDLKLDFRGSMNKDTFPVLHRFILKSLISGAF